MLVKKNKEGRKEGTKKGQVAPVNVSGPINFSDPHFFTYKMGPITVISSYYCC